MSKSGKLIVAIVLVVIIAVGAILIANNKSPEGKPAQSSTNLEDHGAVAITITYDGETFSSSGTTIKSGEKVKVMNASEKDLDFDSDPHPVHTDNSELNAGDIPAGESKTFTLTKKGTWGFHNHLDASQNGKLTVE